MRPINILTEDYIQLETAYGKDEQSIGNELGSLRYKIDEAIDSYAKSDKGTAAYLTLRYSPIFEELTNFKYKTALTGIARKLFEGTSIPLSKATRYSYSLCEMELNAGSGDVADSAIIFGDPKWFDIPSVINEDYSVSYTTDAKKYALKKIAYIQEAVVAAYDNLKSIDENVIHDALYTLANAYTFAKEN